MVLGICSRPSSTPKVECADMPWGAILHSWAPTNAPNRTGSPSSIASEPSPATTHGQQDRVERLGALLSERFALLVELRSARQAGRQGSELTPVMKDGGRVTDGIRALVHEMDQEESRLDDIRQRDALHQWRWTMVLFVGGALAFSLVVFTTSVRRREAEARHLRAEEVSRASELFRIVLQGTDLGVTVQDRADGWSMPTTLRRDSSDSQRPSELLAAPPAELLARFNLLTFEGTPVSPDQLPGRAALQGRDPPKRCGFASRFSGRWRSAGRWCGPSPPATWPARSSMPSIFSATSPRRSVTGTSAPSCCAPSMKCPPRSTTRRRWQRWRDWPSRC